MSSVATNSTAQLLFFSVATILMAITAIHFFFATFGLLMFLNRQRVGLIFYDADQMRAFFDTILAMLFIAGLIITYGIGGNFLSSSEVTMKTLTSIIINLCLQIALVILLQVTQSRSDKRAIEIKTEKLSVKFDLIQLLTDEIRNPH
jgi:fatty acid desaturase